jgi:hypothetical protein
MGIFETRYNLISHFLKPDQQQGIRVIIAAGTARVKV